MAITREDVLRTARLARLKLTDAEIDRFGNDLTRIAAYVEKLREVASGDGSPKPVLPLAERGDSLRDDVPHRCFTIDEAVSGAPDSRDGLFRVPKAIG